jgi:MFS family permease
MKEKIFYGWWIVLACFLIGLYVSGVTFYGFTAFIEPLTREFNWSYTQVSFAASLRGLEMGIFAPLIGFIVDRLGARKVILCGVVTVGCGLILLSFTQSLVMFYGAFLLLAFGAGGCTSLVNISVVANWFSRNVGKALGLMASGFGASGLMVPVIVWLIGVFGWRHTLVILGVGVWVVGIPLSFVIRNKPEEYGYVPDGKWDSAAQPKGEISEEKEPIRLLDLIRNRSFLLLNLTEFVRMMAVSTVATHVMPYLSSAGMSRPQAGFVAAAVPLVSIIGRVSFGWLGDIWAKRRVMALTFGLMGAGLVVFSQIHLAWMLLLFLLLYPPSYGGATVLRGAILREYFGRKSFGKMLGILMGSSSVGGIIGPTLAGWVFDSFGSYQSLWIVYALSTILMIVFILRMRQPA